MMQEKYSRQSKLSVVSALKFFLKGNILFIFSSATIYSFEGSWAQIEPSARYTTEIVFDWKKIMVQFYIEKLIYVSSDLVYEKKKCLVKWFFCN